MKKFYLFAFLAIVFFSSCRHDSIPPPPYQWPEGTSDYAPYTIGSTFNFEISNAAMPNVIDSFTYTVTKDSIINGFRYYKLESSKQSAGATYFANYNNGNLTEITYNLDYLGLGVITVPYVLETTLKENVGVNDTWIESLVVNFAGVNLNVTFAHTMLQKNYTKPILNKNFDNTISVRQVISTIIPPGFPWPPTVPTTSQFDNFYAKGSGLVQRDISDGTSLKLKRFNIVK
jgi:hypothetical protein